jgi:lipopolysaccharide export system permease protein
MMVFDSTVRRELSRSFGATLVVILTIVLTMLLIRTVGQAAKGQVAPQDVVLLLGYVALGNLPTMLTLSLFVAIVITLGRMYRDSEMVIWFASGVGLSRFVRPVLRTSWPVLVVIALLTVFVWPWGNRNGTELRERYAQRSDLSRVTPGVFQSSSDGSRVFFIEREGADGVNARNVFVLSADGDRESVTSASRGRIETQGDAQMLVLERGQRNDVDLASGDTVQASFEDYRVVIGERAASLAREQPPRTLSTRALMADPTLRHQGELAWRLGLALCAANLLLLGVGLSATPARRASSWNLLFALLGFVVYTNLINLSQAWIASGRIAMGPALLVLHGSAFALALGLIAWREHSTVWRLWRPRTQRPRPAAGA